MVESDSGKGSWCFGLNGLFCQMLKGLGYRVYTGAARINREPTGVKPVFHGLVHMVLFVQSYIEDRPGNMRYLVDVSGGALRPILLEQNQRVMGASPSERHPKSSTKGLAPLEWRLEAFHRDKHSESWTSRVMYSFIEDEFFVNEFENFNYSILGLRTS
ncbi:hypothetical protein C8J56DRAFT_942714 [Mycena floridula]|nr:hypothetical protein C8J56DRAFT_942714 [Mycena floridula]